MKRLMLAAAAVSLAIAGTAAPASADSIGVNIGPHGVRLVDHHWHDHDWRRHWHRRWWYDRHHHRHWY